MVDRWPNPVSQVDAILETDSISWQDVRNGIRDIVLVIPGPVSIAMIASIAAVSAGMSITQAFVMVGLSFAGASQLAVLELMRDGSPVLVIIGTAIVINSRFAIFSASLAPYFRDFSSRWRWGLGALLTTPVAVLSLARFVDDESVDRRSYYLGAALPLFVSWQVAVLLGVFLGGQIPAWMDLGFIVTLVFLGLLFPTLKDQPTVAAAIVGGGIAVLAAGLPFDIGFVAGTVMGVMTAQILDRRGTK